MKILTLNTRSLQEENYRKKLDAFVRGILKEMPDLIAMQEVNQTDEAGQIDPEMLEGQYPFPGCLKICRDNRAAQVAWCLRQAGVECSWVWIPVRVGGPDEGVAILCLGRKIRCVDRIPISRGGEPARAVLGVQVEGLEDWFYTVQMGRWDEGAERFLEQWKTLNCCVASKRMCGLVWFMGDLNASDKVRGESYDAVTASGWMDTHLLAENRGDGFTVPEGRRDYIWCSRKKAIRSSRILFRDQPVWNHFALLVETKEITNTNKIAI